MQSLRRDSVFDRLMALLRKMPERDPELEKTRARINAAAARLGTKLGVSTDEILQGYRDGDSALRTGHTIRR